MASSTLCTISFCGSSSLSYAKYNNNKTTTMSSLPQCYCSSSFATNSCLKTFKVSLFSRFSQVGMSHFSPWSGLKHMGISISSKPQKLGRRGKCRGKVVYASLFGVGAPEALVIGVVALLVFGPKGLAEVARNLGKTLRTFQPTIRELQDVSREFKSTLEREIGLDDVPSQTRSTYESNKANITPSSSISSTDESQSAPIPDPNGAPSSKAYSSEDYLKITEEQLKAQQEVMSSSTESQVEPGNEYQASAALQQDVAMSSPPEAQTEPESQTQAAQHDDVSSPLENMIESESQHQETATATPLVQKPESES